jgi:DNA-binding CsgD family transcriptional regulator
VSLRQRSLVLPAPIAELIDALCLTTATSRSGAVPHGTGRIAHLAGGLGSGRTTALVEAAAMCRDLGVASHLLLASDATDATFLGGLLESSAQAPMLLAVDDADTVHHELLEQIVASADVLRTRRMLVLLAVRDATRPTPESLPVSPPTFTMSLFPTVGEAVERDGLLDRLAAVSERVHLAPLDARDIAARIDASGVLSATPDPDLIGALERATGGIPRLLDGVLHDLSAASDLIETRDVALAGTERSALDRVAQALDDPASHLARLAEMTIAALDGPARAAVACTALLDEPFDPVLPITALGEGAEAALDRALTAGVLRPTASGRLAFACEALRRAAHALDPVGRPASQVKLATTIVELLGLPAGSRQALQHLRLAGGRAPRRLLADVAAAALEEARTLGDLEAQVGALEVLWSESTGAPDRWREIGSELASAALTVGQRALAATVAQVVLRSFDGLPDTDLTEERRRVLVATALVATTGHEYLSDEESETAERMLLRVSDRLGDDVLAAPLLARAAEVVSLRPHASAFVRPWAPAAAGESRRTGIDTPTRVQRWAAAERTAEQLLDRAERLIAAHAPDDRVRRAELDVAWALVHLHDAHTDERRRRLELALPHVRGFTRAWAGTRLALDALALGDAEAVERALRGATLASSEPSPLIAWRIDSVRAMLLLASGSAHASDVVEIAALAGRRAAEPMADLTALVQRTVVRGESLSPPSDADLVLPEGGDVHPLILLGRLEQLARRAAEHRAATGEPGAPLMGEARAALDVFRSGGVNRGNLNIHLVLLARVLFLLRDEEVDLELIGEVTEQLAPYGERVPTDVLGLVCFGSSARHRANLEALAGRHAEAEEHGALAARREVALGLDRFVLQGRIDAVARRRLAGVGLSEDVRAELMAVAGAAEERGLARLGREARLAAHPELHGALSAAQVEQLVDLASGDDFRAIAQRRRYSPGTLRKMALPIYRTLGVSGRVEAVARAREVGLLA